MNGKGYVGVVAAFAAVLTVFAGEETAFVPTDVATPVYEIDISSEMDLATWMAEHEVASLSGSGTIVKKGAGKLKITTDALSGFTGAFYICRDSVVEASITKPFGSATNWVERGAAIVLDTAAYTAYNSFVFGGKRLYFEGTGVDGKGAIVYKNVKENYFNGLGPAPTLTGDARVQIPSARHDFDKSTHFYLNGYKLTFDSKNICFGGFTIESGHIENVTGQIICQGTMTFKGGPENTLTFTDGTHQWWGMNRTSTCDWTLITKGRTHQAGNYGRDGGSNIWYGPVRLTGTPSITCYNINSAQTWAGQVSGSYGIKISGASWGINPGLYLTCPTNTFTGGVTVSAGTLNLTVNGALPSASGSGKLTMTDSVLGLTDGVTYALPDADFDGTNIVQKGEGAFRVVRKKGSKTLEWRSLVGAEVVDVQSGTFQFGGTALPPNIGTLVMTNVASTTAAVDLNGVGAALSVKAFTGAGRIVGGGLTVSESLVVNPKTVAAGKALSVAGTLAFAEEATVEVPANLAHGVYDLVTADAISRCPKSANEKWYTQLSADGKTLRLVWGVGLKVFVR